MSSRLFFLATALLASISIAASIAHAQRGGNAGMSSMGGSGFSGGMLGGMSSSLGGTGGFGSGMGGFGSGMGGFGSGMGMGGGMGSGLGGFGSGMGMGGSGMGGFGQSGIGMNQQGNQGFIGRDSADMSAIFSELGRNSNQFMQQLNRTMRRGGGGRRNTTQEENAVPPVRVRLDVAFDQPTVGTAVAASKVRGRMTSLLTRRNIAAPEVEVVGDTVVLRGVAKSESQRLMIERLALMEPGVYSVDNQMTVVEQPTPPAAR